jgi:hypothetical protein
MEARASAMAACDIVQREPAALLLVDLTSLLADRTQRWSIWPRHLADSRLTADDVSCLMKLRKSLTFLN